MLLPEGGTLEYLELAPPCVHPIEPQGGWKPSAVTTTEDVAVTVLQALDLESELPPSRPPLEFRGSDLRLDDGRDQAPATLRRLPRRRRAAHASCCWPTSRETGLYTLSFFGVRAGGQRWLTDGCHTSIICPSPDPTPRWHAILSAVLQKGRTSSRRRWGPTR